VTAAAAATEPAMIPGQRTRASVAAERAAQIALFAQALDAARGRHAEIAQRLAEAGREAADALADLAEAKKERDQLLAAAASWDKTRENAERELDQLARGLERKSQRTPDGELPEAVMASAGASEEQIEARIMTAIDEANVARFAAADAEPVIAERSDALAEATSRRDAVKAELVDAQGAINEAETALKDAKRADARRDSPVTVVVSRKTGKLHVRQGFDDVMSAPVGIAASEYPLGTHVLLATGYNADQTDLVWSGLTAARSAPRSVAGDGTRSSGRRGAAVESAPHSGRAPPQTIAAALERIEIAPEVREQLAELLKPGSTLIVTDEGLGNETGRYTDLIVQTR
jgi:chemotaxis protein histidine kinase CheA